MNSQPQQDAAHTEIIERRKQRSLLFHILYAVDAFDYEVSPVDIALKFNAEYETEMDPYGPITQTVQSIADKQETLDDTIKPFLENWRFERIGRCTLLILRYGTWEMLYTDTPHNIIINEAIELAKCFAEKDAYKFVNGVLDKISIDLQKNNPTQGITLTAIEDKNEEPKSTNEDSSNNKQPLVTAQKNASSDLLPHHTDEDDEYDELLELDEDFDYENIENFDDEL